MNGDQLLTWAAQFGVTAVVLAFVLLRLEAAMTRLTDSYERHSQWLEAWVQSHARSGVGPPPAKDVRE